MFRYKPHFIPTNIVVFGAGGTGSRLLPPLAQLVRTALRKFNPLAWNEALNIYVIDGDEVEVKNLARQNFIAGDVGQNKAHVVSNRYSRAYEVSITGIPNFFGDLKNGGRQYHSFATPTGEASYASIFQNAIIVLAVDSADARKDIISTVFRMNPLHSNQFWIDAGNEDDFGQIKLFTSHILTNSSVKVTTEAMLKGLPAMFPCQVDSPFIPFDWEHYLNLGSSAQERSCADLPQTLAINMMMATLILGTLQNFLQLRTMSYDGLRFSLQGAMMTESCTPARWMGRLLHWTSSGPGNLDFGNYPQDTFSLRLANSLSRNPRATGIDPINFRELITAPSAIAKIDRADIFTKLRSESFLAYKAAGMLMDNEGNLAPIKPAKTPAKKKVAGGDPPVAEEPVEATVAPLEPTPVE